MSRALTAAARSRYAPGALCVLWSRVGSRTAAERFVEAVAGRWERSAVELEEELLARAPAPEWSERSSWKAGPPRARREKGAPEAPRAGSEPPSLELGSEDDVAARPGLPGSDSPEAMRSITSGRAAASNAVGAVGGPGKRSTTGADRAPRRRTADERPGAPASSAVERDVDAADERTMERSAVGGEPVRAVRRPARPLVPGALRARMDHREDVPRPPSRRDARAGLGMSGPMDMDEIAPAGERSSSVDRGPPLDFVGDAASDAEESARRRFEAWTLERRRREEALEEWKGWEF